MSLSTYSAMLVNRQHCHGNGTLSIMTFVKSAFQFNLKIFLQPNLQTTKFHQHAKLPNQIQFNILPIHCIKQQHVQV